MKSAKNLNQIYWATQYCYKCSKCQIQLTNTKIFFEEYKTNLETLLIVFFFIFLFSILSYLKTCFEEGQRPKSNLLSDWILVERLENAKFGRRIQNCFSGNTKQTLKDSRNFLLVMELTISLFQSLSNTATKSSEWLNIGARLQNAKFDLRIPKHFSVKLFLHWKYLSWKLVLSQAKI